MSDEIPFVENWIPIAKHKPEFTIGGRREAEMAVPTIALNPPLDTANITATPEGAATINPMIKLITKSSNNERTKTSVTHIFLEIPSQHWKSQNQ